MRISQDEVAHIIQALSPFMGENNAELRLHGSRVHDDRKGGDIDLLLLTEDALLASLLMEKKHYLLSSIKNRLGDQKIDLLIADYAAAKDSSFLNMILPESIRLKKWEHQQG